MSVVSVVCCQVEISATDWSLVQGSPTDCGASCVIKKPRKRGGWSPLPGCENTTTMGCNARKTNKQTGYCFNRHLRGTCCLHLQGNEHREVVLKQAGCPRTHGRKSHWNAGRTVYCHLVQKLPSNTTDINRALVCH